MEEYIEIGQILKPFGIKGELRIRLYIDDAADLKGLKAFFIRDKKQGWREFAFSSLKFDEDCGFARAVFPEITSRTDAEIWRQVSLYVPKAFLKAPKDAFFVADLIGSEAFFQESSLGVVDNHLDVAGKDMLVIKTKTQMLAVPMTEHYILEIDTSAKRIAFQNIDELL